MPNKKWATVVLGESATKFTMVFDYLLGILTFFLNVYSCRVVLFGIILTHAFIFKAVKILWLWSGKTKTS